MNGNASPHVYTRVNRDRVRLGVIGVGFMGRTHCADMHKVPEVTLAAVCDGYEPNARQAGEDFHVPFFTDHRDLIRSGLCDAVLIATPHPVRPPMAIDCLKAGLHLLSEKPLAECVSAADRMVKTARARQVAFAVMFQRRCDPVYRAARQWIEAGHFGDLCRATLICLEYRPQAYYRQGQWRATWAGEGGGVMINQAPHLMDLFIRLAGMPVEVIGRCETRLHQIETEDHAEALLRYANGATGYMLCTTNETAPGQAIELAGTRGKLVFRDGSLTLHEYAEPVTEFTFNTDKAWSVPECRTVTPEIPATPWGHTTIIQNFARHLLQGEPLVAPGEEGVHSLELANAVWLSSDLRKPVPLPLSRRAYDAFLARKRQAAKPA